MSSAIPSDAAPQSATAPPPPQPAARTDDGLGRTWRVLRIAGALYLVLYFLPFPLTHLGGLARVVDAPLERVVPWFAEHTLGMMNAYRPLRSGSGDTAYAYARSWLLLVVAFVSMVPLERLLVRATYHRFLAWSTVYIRLALAAQLLSYGVHKVIPRQFGVLDEGTLIEPLGSFSPAGLVWAFMATSTIYQQVAGWLEVIPALFLLFHRTARLGALLAIPVLANVVALNMLFDVPVKLHALHLLVVSIALTAPALPAVVTMLCRGDAGTRTATIVPRMLPAAYERAFAVVLLLLSSVGLVWQGRRSNSPGTPMALHGTWEVVERSGRAPAWQVLAIGRTSRARLVGDEMAWVSLRTDTSRRSIDVASASLPGSPPLRARTTVTLAYDHRGDTLRLAGVLGADSLTMRLQRRLDSPRLRSRPFRWIQEFPEIR